MAQTVPEKMNLNIEGVVLAGGKSSRFGADKALARVGGQRLLDKAVNLIRESGLTPTVVGRVSNPYDFLECRFVPDVLPDRGPLGGLYTAFQIFPKSPILVLTCDMPNLTAPVLLQLIAAYTRGTKITIYNLPQVDCKSKQPFPGIYEPSLSPQIADLACANEKTSMQHLFQLVPPRELDCPFNPASFLNVNRIEDLKKSTADN